MFFNKCCFFLPLDTGCFLIGMIFLSFHAVEMFTYTDDCVFVKDMTEKLWAIIIMAGIVMMGTISSALLIYGARRRRSGPVRFWMIVFIGILFLYIFLGIIDVITEKPPLATILIEVMIIISLMYSLMIVHSFHKALKHPSDDDSFVP